METLESSNIYHPGDRVRSVTSLLGNVIATHGEYVWVELECVGGDLIPCSFKASQIRHEV